MNTELHSPINGIKYKCSLKSIFFSSFLFLFSAILYAQYSAYGLAAYTINENSPHQVYVSQEPNTTGGNTWTHIGNLNNGTNNLPGRAKDCVVVGDKLYVVYITSDYQNLGIYVYDLNNLAAGVQPLGSGLFGTLGNGTKIERVYGISRSLDNVYYGISSPTSGPEFIFAFDITTGAIVPNAFGAGVDHIELVMAPGYSGYSIGTNEDMTLVQGIYTFLYNLTVQEVVPIGLLALISQMDK